MCFFESQLLTRRKVTLHLELIHTQPDNRRRENSCKVCVCGGVKSSHIRYSVRGIGLDVDLERDLVVVNEAPLWVSHILKGRRTGTLLIKGQKVLYRFKRGENLFLHSRTWSWRSPSHSPCGRTGDWSDGWKTSRRLCSWWSLAWPARDTTTTCNAAQGLCWVAYTYVYSYHSGIGYRFQRSHGHSGKMS